MCSILQIHQFFVADLVSLHSMDREILKYFVDFCVAGVFRSAAEFQTDHLLEENSRHSHSATGIQYVC